MIVQPTIRYHVPPVMNRLASIRPQNSVPPMPTNHTHFTRNGRGSSGFVTRNTMMPMQTVTNASSVPLDTSSPSTFSGSRPPIRPAPMPVSTVENTGVFHSGWQARNGGGSSPSRDIE